VSGLIIGGVTAGCLYALVALGLVLVFRTSGVLNLAQGATAAAGTFVAVTLASGSGLPAVAAVPAGVAAGMALNVAVYLACVRPLRTGADLLSSMVSTLGADLMIIGALAWIFGYQPRTLNMFGSFSGVSVAGTTVPSSAIAIAGSALLAFGAAGVLLYRTRLGLALRMSASNSELTALSGVNLNRLQLLVWAVAGGFSAWGTMLFASYQTLDTGMADTLLIASAVAASFGAFRSIPLTLAGAVAVSAAQDVIERYVPADLVSTISLPLLVAAFLAWQRRAGGPADRLLRAVREQPRLMAKRLRTLPRAEIALVTVVGLAAWWYGSDYQVTLLQQVAGTLVAIAGMALIVRYGQRLNLAAGGLMTLAAYVAVIAARQLPTGLAVTVAVVVTAMVGGLIGALAAGMDGIFYAVITLTFTAAIAEIANLEQSLTGGAQGISVPSLIWSPVVGGLTVPLYIPVTAAAMVAFYWFGLSPLGARSLLAATDRHAARACGLHPLRYFVAVEVAAAALLGLAGIMLADATGYLSPGQWGTPFTLLLVAGALIAGGWTVAGLAGGTLAVVAVPQLVGGLNGWPPIMFGAALALAAVFAPNGLDGVLSRGLRRIAGRPARADGPYVPQKVA
jgi:branched-chain amino acid transport system permease protein